MKRKTIGRLFIDVFEAEAQKIGGAMLGNFYSSGQVCSNGTRVFVQDDVYDRFLERLAERTKTMERP